MTALPVFRLAFPFHNPTTNRLLNSIAESLVQKPSLESEKNEHMVYAGNDKWASTKWLQEQREKKEVKRKEKQQQRKEEEAERKAEDVSEKEKHRKMEKERVRLVKEKAGRRGRPR